MTNKFCINCKHEANFDCHRVGYQGKVSLVTGRQIKELKAFPPTCHAERNAWAPWRCGKSGRYFATKENPNGN